jgi:hypothetical protein
VSSVIDAGEAVTTNSAPRTLDFHVISKLLAVDTEVDPPQQNSPTPTESRDQPARYSICFWLLGGTTSASSGIDAGEADTTNSASRILDFHIISKLLAVDTEVDPPQQNGPTPTESRDQPARYSICFWLLGGTTSASSGTDAGEADTTNRA